MLILLWKPLLVAFSLLTGLALLTQTGSPVQTDLAAFLLPPEGCAPPCWQGIRPGETTAQQAIATLSAHPWGGRVVTDHYDPIRGRGLISWVLDDVGLEQIRRFRGVRLRLRRGVVETITLPPGIPLSDIWLTFGKPTSGESLVVRPMGFAAFRLEHYAYFADYALFVRSRADCPTSIPAFWRGYTVIEIGEPHSNYIFHRLRQESGTPAGSIYQFLRQQHTCQ